MSDDISPVIVTNTSSAALDAPLALVMKGGGVKGLAYVGALEVLREKYTFNWFVGTSAGAIAASLLGAGYDVAALKSILLEKDFRDFFDANPDEAASNFKNLGGMFTARSMTDWLNNLLAQKLEKIGLVKFSDLRHRVTVYVSKRNSSGVRLDSELNSDLVVAQAVRCSMSIPGIFVPDVLDSDHAFDGGMQNNYPAIDFVAQNPGVPFIGLYLGPQTFKSVKEPWFIQAGNVWLESKDVEALDRFPDETIVIDPYPIGTLDFGLSNEEKEYLIACGRERALNKLEKGSLRHTEAVAAVTKLRTVVEQQRTVSRPSIEDTAKSYFEKFTDAAKQKVAGCASTIATLFVLFVLVPAVCFSLWYFWPTTPNDIDLSIGQGVTTWQIKATEKKLPEFIDAYAGDRVTWPAYVVEVNDHSEAPSLEIAETLDSPHVRCEFELEAFKKAKALEKGTKIELRGIISNATNPIALRLEQCEVIKIIELPVD